MASVKIQASVKLEVKIESTAPADLFKGDITSMDVDLPERNPLDADADDLNDEPESEEEDEADSSPPSESAKSRSETPALPAKKEKPGPQLIGHLPRAEEEAMKTFIQLQDNFYQYQTLGRSREALESMTCDCVFTPGQSRPHHPSVAALPTAGSYSSICRKVSDVAWALQVWTTQTWPVASVWTASIA